MTSVAARYGVSSSFLARVCTRLNIPRPPRSYWAKVEFGQAPEKPDLPAPQPGDVLEWSRDRESMLGRLREARALLGGLDALERFTEWKSAEER